VTSRRVACRRWHRCASRAGSASSVDEPADSALKLTLFFSGVLLFACVAIVVVARSRPWYVRRRVIDQGTGRLYGAPGPLLE
jgi:hypothetical protein